MVILDIRVLRSHHQQAAAVESAGNEAAAAIELLEDSISKAQR